MKRVLYFLPIVLLLTSCFSQQNVVEYDYSYQGKFSQYKTFSFIKDSQEVPDSARQNDKIVKDAIKYRLELQGYKFNKNKPNLLVSYKIFYGEVKNYRGYRQPDINNWVKTGEKQDEDDKYNPVTYNLSKGTLLVSLFDRKTQNTIWQGYASGVFSLIYNPESKRHLTRAVRSIFDRYRFMAEGFDQKKFPESE